MTENGNIISEVESETQQNGSAVMNRELFNVEIKERELKIKSHKAAIRSAEW